MIQNPSMSVSPGPVARQRDGAALTLTDGTIEAVKWFALVLMTGDHINAYLLDWNVRWLFDAGRLVMPLFGVMLAYNLARDGVTAGTRIRTLKRMAFYAILAAPAYIYKHGYWPLNILATLGLFVFIVHCIERHSRSHTLLAIVAFVLGGAVVEFWWFGLSVCLAAWLYFKSPNNFRAFALIASILFLSIVNGNYYALASVPVLLIATRLQIAMPRSRQAFYIYYPMHLTILAVISMWLSGK